MLFAIRTIQERTGEDLGATFSGTNYRRNSLTELYLLFKYLHPKELERQDIRCFDASSAIFAKKTTDFEFNVTNNVVQEGRHSLLESKCRSSPSIMKCTDYPHGRGCGRGPSQQKRDTAPHTATAEQGLSYRS